MTDAHADPLVAQLFEELDREEEAELGPIFSKFQERPPPECSARIKAAALQLDEELHAAQALARALDAEEDGDFAQVVSTMAARPPAAAKRAVMEAAQAQSFTGASSQRWDRPFAAAAVVLFSVGAGWMMGRASAPGVPSPNFAKAPAPQTQEASPAEAARVRRPKRRATSERVAAGARDRRARVGRPGAPHHPTPQGQLAQRPNKLRRAAPERRRRASPQPEASLVGLNPAGMGRHARRAPPLIFGRGQRGMEVATAQERSVALALAPDVVSQVVSAHRNRLVRCYQSSVKKNEALEGELQLLLTILPTGQVVGVETRRLQDSYLVKCLGKEMKQWTFPPFEGPAQTLLFPLQLSRAPPPETF